MAEREEQKKLENAHSSNERKTCTIDVSLLTSKLAYFILGAKTSCYEPFMVVFMISIGLSPSKAGLVGGLRVIGALIGSPLWAFLADLKGIHKYIGVILCVGSLLLMFIQPFVSLSIGELTRNRCPQILPKVNSTWNTTFHNEVLDTERSSSYILFYVMLFLNVFAKFFDGAQAGFVDNAVVEKCAQNPRKSEFGKQRLFGAIGFGTGVLLTTFAVEYFPQSGVSCYTGMVVVFASLTFIFICVFWLLQSDITVKKKEDISGKPEGSKLGILLKTLVKPDTLIFLLTALIVGVMQCLYLSYTVLFLKDIGANPVINGVSIAVAAFSCIFTFFWGADIIRFLRGTYITMTVCCFSYFVRFIAVGYLTEPWTMPLIQSLQAIGFGLFINTSVLHIKTITPVEVRTTMYGIFNAIFYGASFVIGNIAGGYLYTFYKAKYLFIGAAYCSLAWTSLILFYLFMKKVLSNKKSESSEGRELEVLSKQHEP